MAIVGVTESLRTKGVAASTIRQALGEWILETPNRLIAALAKCPSTLDDLINIQADAKAYYQLRKELERAMNQGGVEEVE